MKQAPLWAQDAQRDIPDEVILRTAGKTAKGCILPSSRVCNRFSGFVG